MKIFWNQIYFFHTVKKKFDNFLDLDLFDLHLIICGNPLFNFLPEYLYPFCNLPAFPPV